MGAIWKPQPGPQTHLFTCPVFEVLYGGARGGGKTDGMLGLAGSRALKYRNDFIGIFFRRKLVNLEEAIERAKALYIPLGALWREQKKVFIFPGGGRLKFAYLDKDVDAEGYQGHSYTDVYFEELTQFPSPKPVDKLRATLRSGAGVPVIFRATANPGGAGHSWVRARYIDPAPGGYKVMLDPDTQQSYCFIPAKLQDNRILMENDPLYIERLKGSGSENLVRAWLLGDWNVVDGAYFDDWSPEMVLKPFKVPAHWMRFRSLDWGSAKPFSCGWWAVSDGEPVRDGGACLPSGALLRYREWYGMVPNKPNVGIKLDAEALASGIRQRDGGERIDYGVAGPDLWKVDGGPSMAERMATRKVYFRRADTQRISGWDQLRGRMKGTAGGLPMIYVFESCTHSIRTIPMLTHDEVRPEDLDTEGEDHCADEWRFACMSRPWKRVLEEEPAQRVGPPTFNELLEANRQRHADTGRQQRI